ncbi:MAG: hypothetical protein KDI75_08400 [Xanthomonadales bacterium]|nr:hypothetical protein [Xanthomonadales bacterium]
MSMPKSIALLAAALAAANVSAQSAVPPRTEVISTRDQAAIAVSYYACYESFDEAFTPEARTIHAVQYQDGTGNYRHTLRVRLRQETGVICPGLPPPASTSVGLGLLPAGYHRVNVQVTNSDTTVQTFEQVFHVGDSVQDWVSGAWYSPEQNGRGLFLTKLPLAAYPDDQQKYSIYWATHDSEGQPTWLLTTAAMTDFVVEGQAISTDGAPLSAEPAFLQPRVWGELAFEYLGCGKGRLSWDGNDPAIADGSIEVIQLARPVGLPACVSHPNVDAIWLE